jgi:hypothetical protein
VADADNPGCGERRRSESVQAQQPPAERGGEDVADPDSSALQPWRIGGRATQASGPEWWSVEPEMGGGPDGLSAGLSRNGGLDAETTQTRSNPPLQGVWRAVGAQALQRAFGGPQRVPEAPLLRPGVHGSGLCQRHALELGLAEASYPIPWEQLRIVWGYGEPARPSHRRELTEQLAREHPNLVWELSCLAPPPCSSCWQDGSWEEGLARTAKGVPERLKKLRALGNAVVPQIPEFIGRRILEFEQSQQLPVAA